MMCDECNEVFLGVIQQMVNGRHACDACTWTYYCVCCGQHRDDLIGTRVDVNGEMMCTGCANIHIDAQVEEDVEPIEVVIHDDVAQDDIIAQDAWMPIIYYYNIIYTNTPIINSNNITLNIQD